MSLKLRPQGKPCLRSLQGTLMVVVGVVALATAPAATAQEYTFPLAWYDEPAAIAQTVQFEDVAAAGDTVVAVGHDTATRRAVIYTRIGDSWQREALATPAGSKLVDVELATGTSGWAVGSWSDADGATHPLVLRLSGSWSIMADKVPAGAIPTAVAIEGDTVTIGDANGDLHRSSATDSARPTTTSAAAAGAINGIELFGDQPGLAVADFEPLVSTDAPDPDDKTVRIYELGATPVLKPAQTETGTQVDITGLAATAPEQAVALDSAQTTWRVGESGDWKPETEISDALPTQRRLRAVGSVPGGEFVQGIDGWGTEFLAGELGPIDAPKGALWQRTRWGDHEEAWSRHALPAGTPALSGVTATRWDAAWAVGAKGTIIRYWRPPDQEAEQRALAEEQERQRLAAEEAERQRLAEEERLRQEELRREEAERAAAQRQEEQAAAAESAEERDSTPPPPPPPPPPPAPERDEFRMNGIVIDDPTAPRRNPPTGTQRLLKDVKAMRKGRKLVVSFRLTARARVAITAKRGNKVIARTRMRTLRKGRRTLVLRFRGKPPGSLKVIVRRVSGAGNTR
jgi:hypothetical protein